MLGIDNLVFIGIFADNLPPHQREKARLIGLSLALIMRLALLASIGWIVTLTQPLFSVLGLGFSGRDLILIFGGLFLLFKGTMELHERLEGHVGWKEGKVAYAVFWQVLVQIVVTSSTNTNAGMKHSSRPVSETQIRSTATLRSHFEKCECIVVILPAN